MAGLRSMSSEGASVSRWCESRGGGCATTARPRLQHARWHPSCRQGKLVMLLAAILPRTAAAPAAAAAVSSLPALAMLPSAAPVPSRRAGRRSPQPGQPHTGSAPVIIHDILGIAQSMVDVTTETAVGDDVLERLGVTKGGRRVLTSVEERTNVLAMLEAYATKRAGGSLTSSVACPSWLQITPGGSLANTLVAIARLSQVSERTKLNVALSASCSSDSIGHFFSESLSAAGVSVLPNSSSPGGELRHDQGPVAEAASGHTGTVFVLPSADGQRSFLSYFESEKLQVSPLLRKAISHSKLVVVEGYMWEMPEAAAGIAEVVATARGGGARVALTAGDAGVVSRNREKIMQVLLQGGNDIIFFANKEEACALRGEDDGDYPAEAAARELGKLCSVAVVTDGAEGSYVAYKGQVHTIPRVDAPQGAVDTCGAGDAYAAGFCYAILTGHDCSTAGRFASSTAAKVISRHGAQLEREEAQELVDLLPERKVTLPEGKVALAGGVFR